MLHSIFAPLRCIIHIGICISQEMLLGAKKRLLQYVKILTLLHKRSVKVSSLGLICQFCEVFKTKLLLSFRSTIFNLRLPNTSSGGFLQSLLETSQRLISHWPLQPVRRLKWKHLQNVSRNTIWNILPHTNMVIISKRKRKRCV